MAPKSNRSKEGDSGIRESEYYARWAEFLESEQDFHLTFDSITNLMTVQDTNYRILGYNRAVEEKFGKGLEGKICYEVYPGRKDVCPGCPTKKAIETRAPPFSFQAGHDVSDPVDIYAYPIFDEKGGGNGRYRARGGCE